jgi:predicted DNA repair protein MutK
MNGTLRMSGLLALLDDVVALTKLAAATLDDAAGQAVKAGSKAAGVVIDDAAVTPRYVTGLAAQRELPIVGRIALGSLKNKLVFLLPAALLLTVFLPNAITPLLMLGGLYLCFEGYEKVHHMLAGHAEESTAAASPSQDAQALEDEKVTGAIRTDFILSAEIMAIALASITAPDLVTQALVLAVVGVMITVVVYGAVALIVKADDFGVYLAQRESAVLQAIGRALVYGMPPFLQVLSFIGMLAMLWVGGGILVHGLNEYGVTLPEHVIHAVSESVRVALPLGSDVFAWVAGAAGAAVVGLAAGAVTALVVFFALTPFAKAKPSKP